MLFIYFHIIFVGGCGPYGFTIIDVQMKHGASEADVTQIKEAVVSIIAAYRVLVIPILKTEQENPRIGLIICKEKDEKIDRFDKHSKYVVKISVHTN